MAPYHSSTLRFKELPEPGRALETTDGTYLGTVTAVQGNGEQLMVELRSMRGEELKMVLMPNLSTHEFDAVSYTVDKAFPDFKSVHYPLHDPWPGEPVSDRDELTPMPEYPWRPWTPSSTPALKTHHTWTTAPLPTAAPSLPPMMPALPPGETWWVEDEFGNMHLIEMLTQEQQQEALSGRRMEDVQLDMVRLMTLMVSSQMSSEPLTQRKFYWMAIEKMMAMGLAREIRDGSKS